MEKKINGKNITVAIVGHPYQSQKLRIFFDEVYEYFKEHPDARIINPEIINLDSFPVKETR